jgi:glyoxylase-like metal-dependent hydrolase (beta-lactamase superfamily II)
MLHLQSFIFNPLQENTYLIINEKKQCWIVDPGMYDNSETNKFIQYITEKELVPQAIINTHTHFDHIFGVKALKDKYNIPFAVHEKDMPVLKNAIGSAMMFGFDIQPVPEPDFFLKENELFQLGDDTVEIRFTPGHSPGSIVFYHPAGNWVIGGDVLFAGSIGRTDLPGGDFETLINSIETQLLTLPDITTVHPGHGPATTVANEKKYNPFLVD